MAAPNLINLTTSTGKSVGAALTTSSADILTNSVASDKVLKVNTVYVSNVDGAANADVNVTWYDASAAATYSIAKTIVVPADASLIVVDKNAPIYLEEGDKLSAFAGVNGDLEITVSYEELA
jgi:hypothetical protein